MERQCKHDACDRPVGTAGYCNAHYIRRLRGKDMDAPVRETFQSVEERFWSKTEKQGGCLIWMGSLLRGYGQFRYKGATRYAHRVAYELAYGSIPEGMHLDHTCWNRQCVTPEHLKVVTQALNNQNYPGARSDSRSGVRGVWWESGRSKWVACAQARGAGKFMQRFDTLEEAEAAVVEWRRENMPNSLLDRGQAA